MKRGKPDDGAVETERVVISYRLLKVEVLDVIVSHSLVSSWPSETSQEYCHNIYERRTSKRAFGEIRRILSTGPVDP